MERQREKREISIIRIAGKDINGSYKIIRALLQIKGVGHSMAHAIAVSCSRLYGIDMNSELGSLSDEQLAHIESVMKDPMKAGIPAYMTNRRKDFETGDDMHLAGADLIVRTRQDIDREIRLQTWIGSRHQYGQKVRGQRTRSTGRTGATVGVVKKAVQEQQKEAAKKGGEAKA